MSRGLAIPARRRILATGLAAACASAGVVPGQVTRRYEVVALQGEPAPSAGPTAAYGIMGFAPRIGQGGHIVFGSFVGNNGPGSWAVWTGKPGSIRALAVQGDPVPGRDGETLDVFFNSSGSPYWICPDGSAAFHARSSPSNQPGYWLGTPGDLRAVAQVGNSAPDLPAGVNILEFLTSPFLANGDGEALVAAKVAGAGITSENDTLLWHGTPNDLRVLAREADLADGLDGGVRYGDFTFSETTLSSLGQLAFTTRLQGTPLSQNEALMAGTPGALRPVVRKGDPIRDVALHGNTLGAPASPRINWRGLITYKSTPSPSGNPAIFFHRAGRDYLVAEETAVPPGAPDSTWAQFFFARPVLSGGGMVAFNGGLAPGANFDRDGIWARGGGTTLVVRKGDPVPGSTGDRFDAFQWETTYRGPAINEDSVIVFRAMTASGQNGLWCWHDGDLQLLLATGDFLELGPGDVRRVADFSVKLESGGHSGFPSCLNDRGQLVFRASFNTGRLGTAVLLVDNILDRDGDGVSSFLESALGGDDDDFSDRNLLLPTLHREADELLIRFPRRTDDAFSYQVEVSSDLFEWFPHDTAPTRATDQSALPAGTERYETRVAVLANQDTYLRLRVTRNN